MFSTHNMCSLIFCHDPPSFVSQILLTVPLSFSVTQWTAPNEATPDICPLLNFFLQTYESLPFQFSPKEERTPKVQYPIYETSCIYILKTISFSWKGGEEVHRKVIKDAEAKTKICYLVNHIVQELKITPFGPYGDHYYKLTQHERIRFSHCLKPWINKF